MVLPSNRTDREHKKFVETADYETAVRTVSGEASETVDSFTLEEKFNEIILLLKKIEKQLSLITDENLKEADTK